MAATSVRPAARAALRCAPAALAIVLLALFPIFVTKPYPIGIGVSLFLAVLVGSAWNILGGYAGQYSVGHAAYFGVGAYTAVMLFERLHVPPWFGLPAAMLAAVLVGVVIGTITFRLRGPYFVLASIAVAEIIRLAALHFRGFTNGAEGFVVAGAPTLHLLGLELSLGTKRSFYWLTLALAVGAVLVSRAVRRARLGYLLLAIREDQDAAHSLGIGLAWNKNLALALSAALTGLAGAVFAGYTRFIDPNTVFSLTEVSVRMVLICLLGGIGTVHGPIIGAVLLVLLEAVLVTPRGLVTIGLLPSDSALVAFVGKWLSPAYLLVEGVIMVLLILFAPEGVAGLLRRVRARRRETAAAAPSPAP
ncbi:MAG TPA: branched-chain amino acid ABC transporter permease [Anaeromyxobacter sp.]|nr:branched-chain amino acid ABC transporter permease [Anaeromyxobacter sp.]